MYPFVRMAKEILSNRNAPPLAVTGTHVSQHICWPWDLDFWRELNNGRTLTLFDLGRVPMAGRVGLFRVMKLHGWGLTVAGNTTRYRRRVRVFDRLEMRSRCLGWDERFAYMEQAMYRKGDCTSHMLLRAAFTSPNGIVAPEKVISALGQTQPSPPLPDWVTAWVAAEAARPWPPVI